MLSHSTEDLCWCFLPVLCKFGHGNNGCLQTQIAVHNCWIMLSPLLFAFLFNWALKGHCLYTHIATSLYDIMLYPLVHTFINYHFFLFAFLFLFQSCAGPSSSKSNLILHFVGMGFSEEMVAKAIKENGMFSFDDLRCRLLYYLKKLHFEWIFFFFLICRGRKHGGGTRNLTYILSE